MRYATAADLATLSPPALTVEQQAALDRSTADVFARVGRVTLDGFAEGVAPRLRPLEAQTTWRGRHLEEAVALVEVGEGGGVGRDGSAAPRLPVVAGGEASRADAREPGYLMAAGLGWALRAPR